MAVAIEDAGEGEEETSGDGGSLGDETSDGKDVSKQDPERLK